MPVPNPLVSVIIPYYNRPEKLERCINAVVQQTHPSLEIIVVDDASSTPPSTYHDSVTYIKNSENGGPGFSRNAGMAVAKGTFLAFLDSDDYWAPSFLEKTVAILEAHPEVVMAYSNVFLVNEKEETVGIRRKKERMVHQILPEILVRGRAWCTSSCLWRASVIHQVSWLSVRIWEDYAFDVDVAIKNNNVKGTKEKYVYYDASGDDKLSGIVDDATILEKSKSLQYVSKLLERNFSKKDKKISRAISRHLLNQLIQLLGMKNKVPSVIQENEAALRYWSGPFIGRYIQCTSLLNLKLRITFLRKIRRKFF